MRRRFVRGGLIGCAALYAAVALMTGSSSAQLSPPFTFPTFPTIPPPTMPPSTSATTSPPPTMPPSTSPTSSPPPTMSPTSLPLPPSTDELAEQIIQDFEDIADRISEFLEEAGVLLQDQ